MLWCLILGGQRQRSDAVLNRGALKPITGARFRANPAYEIVLLDRLPYALREEIEGHGGKDSDTYGVLLPRLTGGLTPKTICHETALLFYSMAQPGPLPAYVHERLGAECNQAVAELVLDGVLEIADDDGTFRSGGGAEGLVYHADALELGTGSVSDLSREALRYGQLVPVDSSARLANRLYCYNTIPISPRWRARLPSTDAVERFLAMETGTSLRHLLSAHWELFTDPAPTGGWWRWRRLMSRGGPTPSVIDPTYKLYVSPAPEALPQVWPTIVRLLADLGAPAFKIGQDVMGLLRPDKIVVYFASFEDLARLGRELASELADCPAQGTPFTAAIGESGLLSWGMDPPAGNGTPQSSRHQSWRSWVTQRLAVALMAARHEVHGIEPWRFALQRMALEGVDVRTWAPSPRIWTRARSA